VEPLIEVEDFDEKITYDFSAMKGLKLSKNKNLS
jgi:hypothetical protein